MTTFTNIIFTIESGVARLTLNRPDRLNAFNEAMHREVEQALDVIQSDAAVRVLLLTGAGRGFSAGQDLSERRGLAHGIPVDLGASLDRNYNPLIRRLTGLRVPVIAAVNGVAAGAGANIALACDLVIATQSARFIQSFAGLGLLPDSGGTWALSRLVGQARALGLALTGEPLAAADAEAWGLIWRVVPDEAFRDEVEVLAEKLAQAPTRALFAIKRAIREAPLRTLDEQLDRERDLQRELGKSADYMEGVAAFHEKRSPRFRGA